MKLFKKLSVMMTTLIIVLSVLSNVSVTVFADTTTVSVNATDITLYALNEGYNEYLQIPKSYKTSFQIKVTGAKNISYIVSEGESVEVSETGLITPASQTWYYSDNFATTSYLEDAKFVTEKYIYGDSVVTVTADDKTFDINVSVEDYAWVYANDVMDTFIAENITSSMTTGEKLETIARFVAGQGYNEYYSDAYTMFAVGEGGDCWASTDAVAIMATKLGFEAWWIDASYGAGSNHVNAMVYDGETYFQVEASMYAYVSVRDSLFRTTYNEEYDGCEIYMYDGPTIPEEFTIPSEIDGMDVVSIGDFFLSGARNLRKVNLPSTVKSLGDWAFNRSGITTFELPESVEKIGAGTFNLPNLKEFKGNSKFVFEDGMLYDVENDILVAVPNAKSVDIPDTCVEIGNGAFYGNKNIREVIISSSVTKMGEGVFNCCENLQKVELGENVTSVDDYTFCGFYNLRWVIALNPDCTFSDMAFEEDFAGTIFGHEYSTAQTYAEKYGYTFDLIENAGNILINRPIGDANCDDAFNVSDAAFIARTLANGHTISFEENPFADFNWDNKITVSDAAAIARELANPKIYF